MALVVLIDLVSITGNQQALWLAVLAVSAVGALGLFLFAELRAAEPILPLRMFANRTVWSASIVGLCAGFVMFGAVTCLPLFLQAVKGADPLASGLDMLPLMAGIPLASVLSGQFITRTGKYRGLPILGMAAAGTGLFFMSRMTASTPMVVIWASMFSLGIGIGMTLQVLLIAVQNAVSYRDLGVATSSAILFRFIGGSLGTAILGTVFAASLSDRLALLPPDDAEAIRLALAPEMVQPLPEVLQAIRSAAVTSSLNDAFLVAALVACGGFAFAWLLPALPLRETIAAANEDVGGSVGRSMAIPTDTDSATELRRGLSVVAQRDTNEETIQKLIEGTGVDLHAAAVCLLLSAKDGILRLVRSRSPGERERKLLEDLQQAGYGERHKHENGETVWRLTPKGVDAIRRLTTSRLARLRSVCAEWGTDSCSEKDIDQLSRAIVTGR